MNAVLLQRAMREVRARAHVTRVLAGIAATAVAFGIAACDDTVAVAPQPVAGKIVVLSGDNQTGRVDELALNPVTVEVHDTRGLPMAGALVTFASSGNGSFATDQAVSDSEGVASALFNYGTVEGDYTITAAIDGVADAAHFVMHAKPGPALNLEAVAGNAQTAPVGTALPTPITVQVLDVFGNPIAGAVVTWSATGGGTLSAATSVTDANGNADVLLTLGATPGAEVVTAHVDNLQNATFNVVAN